MSVEAMASVWKRSPNKDSTLVVELALADMCDDRMECWPSVSYLAFKCRITERQVQRCINALKKQGILSVGYGKGRSGKGTNLFRLNHDAYPERKGDIHVTPDKLSPPTSTSPSPGDTEVTPTGGTHVTQNISSKHHIPPTVPQTPNVGSASFPSGWDEVVDFCKKNDIPEATGASFYDHQCGKDWEGVRNWKALLKHAHANNTVTRPSRPKEKPLPPPPKAPPGFE